MATVLRDSRLRVGVLGPIRVVDPDGRDITPDGALQRRLLALLVLRRGRTVTAESAIDALWPTRPPQDPAAALHNHLFRLRRGLPDGVIESTGDGYCLVPSQIELDVDHLVVALDEAGAGPRDPTAEDRRAAVEAILERWRGPAYPELADVDDGRAESMRLDELRQQALEAQAERRLRHGDTDGLVAELAGLVDAAPLRERPRALLMATLAATGRQAEALRVYDDFRRLLGGELGIEPSPSLAAQHAELLAGAGAGAAGWAPASRLPVPATSLVGREALVDEVTAVVRSNRLVTLVGPGGVGKTRLAIEVGRRLREARPDRPVVMAELSTAVEDSAVEVVAAALAIDARPGVELDERIATVLADSAVVLILDNCEHVVDAAAELVGQLLGRCPDVTVVATSRERLRVAGEQLRAVSPLLAGAADAPAVRLFVERARSVAPNFEPDDDQLASVIEIARRLDGLPLAIELAAARLHTMSVAEVAAGLDERFALLSSGYRTSTRHGSLAAAVSWSYGLLDTRLQQTFVELSVFAGPFTTEDAAAVCGASVAAVSADLVQLTERSLVLRTGDGRYVLLETLRAFGAAALIDAGRAEEVGRRHAEHQIAWAERADRRLMEPGSPSIAEIDAALPELRAGFVWLLDRRHVYPAARLVTALLDYGIMRLRPDVLVWADRVTDDDLLERSPHAPVVWVVAAYASWMSGDVAACSARARRALLAAEDAGGAVPAEVATICGNDALFDGRLDDAMAWYDRAMEAADDDPAQQLLVAATRILAMAYAGHPDTEEVATRLLADVGDAVTAYAAYAWYCAGEADLGGDVDRARSRLGRAIELAELTNTSFVVGIAGASKASIDARTGDPHAAAEEYRRLITHWRRAGMWSTQWTMLRSIAGLLHRLERHRDAAVLEGAVRSTAAGHRIFGADAAALDELGAQLRAALGDDAYRAALDEGATLDGDAAVEHALRAL
ncbi:MAG: BTAD domain-containing putative transcriptional regulator [Ilumatobacteraceae bacterium]